MNNMENNFKMYWCLPQTLSYVYITLHCPFPFIHTLFHPHPNFPSLFSPFLLSSPPLPRFSGSWSRARTRVDHLCASQPHPLPSLTHYNQLGDRPGKAMADESREIILLWIIHPSTEFHPTYTLLLLSHCTDLPLSLQSLRWLSLRLHPQ